MTKQILPVQKEKVEVKDTSEVAAGITAVASSIKSGVQQMGLVACTKSFLTLNQTHGFDCPSCAWPDPLPSERSKIAEYCENGARAVADEGTTKRANPKFWKKHSISELMEWSEYKLGKSGRITHPMILREGSQHYEPINWADAFQLIGDKLNSLDSPNEAVFYTSGRASNEAAYLYQLFSRMYGTNNLPDCSNLCHESTGRGLSEVIGYGKGTVKLEDFYVADLIIVIGQNPGTNHPRMMSALQKCKRRGGKIISVNPLPETGLKSFKNPQEVQGWIGSGTTLTDLFLQVKINEDIALLKAIMRELLNREEAQPGSTFDHDFIQEYTDGYADFIADLKRYNVQEMADKCGISKAKIVEAADMIQNAKRMIICWAMGITQHRNGVSNVKEIVNLLLLRGAMGIPGAGACPVRGHSNVQGDRTVGIWDVMKPSFAKKLKDRFDFDPPMEQGYNAVKSIEAMHDGKVKVYISLGGNLLLAGPDTAYTARGMNQCDLTVMISTKPNRNHLVTGKTALILPCLGRTERDIQQSGQQFYSVENSMAIVHSSKGVLSPASKHLLSEPAIIASIAKATVGDRPSINWLDMVSNYDFIRSAIEKTVPGFDNYNERVRREGGFYLPKPPGERVFNTPSGKAIFTVVDVPSHRLKKGEYLMTTIRSHDQFNTTIYGHDDRYRGIYNGRRVIFMNKKDIETAGLNNGDIVDISSHYEVERLAPQFRVVEYSIPQGCVATYFPETNVLVPFNKYARKSEQPVSKSIIVRLKKVR